MACWSQGAAPQGELGNDAMCAQEIERDLCADNIGGDLMGMWQCVTMCGVSTWYCLDTDNTWSHNQSMEAVTLTLVSSGQMEHPCPLSGPRTKIML